MTLSWSRSACLLLITILLLMATGKALAEGSVNLTAFGGNRPFTEWVTAPCPLGCNAGIPRRTIIRVYANAGEEINLGSSVYNSLGGGTQDIVFRSPNGTQSGTCDVVNGGFGHIDTRAKELAGPAPLAGGYTPCAITVAGGEAGVWEVEFHAPAATGNPPNIVMPSNGPFPYNAPAGTLPAITTQTTNATVAAWDVTVRTTPGVAGTEVTGRVFSNALALNLGSNNRSLNSRVYVVTNDGYQYVINMNGIDAFGFILFSNTTGIEDTNGNPRYQSIQLIGNNPGALPPGSVIRDPNGPDNPAGNQFTHKIFFNPPDPSMPSSAPMVGGATTWLNNPPEDPGLISNLQFTGSEGTSGQTGTPPLFGNFTFDSPKTGSYTIIIDLNNNGVYGDGNDRILTGIARPGQNIVPWDVRDQFGVPVPAGTVQYNSQATLYGGEVHFPILDPENNPQGISIERIVDPNTTVNEPDPFTINYDDSYTYTGANTYDYSLCGQGETPPPPDGSIVAPACYGSGPVPRNAFNGVLSTTGAHEWTNFFGDRRMMDTWAYYPSNVIPLNGAIIIAEADLAVVKTDLVDPIPVGGTVTYSITVSNLGPSNANGATFVDTFPPYLTNITWSCVPSAGASCTANGAGNISDTVNIPNGGTLTYTITSTAAANAPTPILNSARVDRPPDVTDPNLANNVDDEETAILTVITGQADLAVVKTDLVDPIPVGGTVTYSITVSNLGPDDAPGAMFVDTFPPYLTNITWSCVPSAGASCTANGAGNISDTVNIPNGGTLTYTISATVSPAAPDPMLNTARIDRPPAINDPNLANNIDDEQTSVIVAGPLPDLRIVKTRIGEAIPDSDLSYTLEISNVGVGPTQGPVTVTDTLPRGLTYIAAGGAAWSCGAAGQSITCDYQGGAVSPGQMLPLIFITAHVDPNAPSPLLNVAEVRTPGDYNPANNRDENLAEVANLSRAGALIIQKASQAPFAAPGQIVVWTVTVRNTGAVPVTNVVVQDVVPADLEILSAQSPLGTVTINGQMVTAQHPVLGPGAALVLTIRSRIRPQGGVALISNRASVTADGISVPGYAGANTIGGITHLPRTGETPSWRGPLLAALVSLALLALLGGLRHLRRVRIL